MSERKTRGKAADDKRLNLRIGAAIRKAADNCGLSLADVAEKIGISAQQFHKYVNGTDRIRAATLKRVADVLKVPVADLYPA